MRNNGWYIPYWRKLKRKGKAEKPGAQNAPDVNRSDEQLEAVRRRWIERYRRTARSLGVMGLSMGSNRSDVQARYNALREAGTLRSGELEEAYRYLSRVLPPLERRKRRPQPSEQTPGGAPVPSPVQSGVPGEIEVVATVEVYAEVMELEGDADELEDDLFAEDDDDDQDGSDFVEEDEPAPPAPLSAEDTSPEDRAGGAGLEERQHGDAPPAMDRFGAAPLEPWHGDATADEGRPSPEW